MSENKNRGIDGLSPYDAMTTEELEEILRLDAQAPEEQESDTEKILYIMEVLAKRNKQNNHTGNKALKAYESFKQNYMPETDDTIIPIKTRRRAPRWVRSLTATAAVFAILVVGSVTAKAFGFNLWKTVIQWTQETFHFGTWGSSTPNNTLEFDSLQRALTEGNAPAWLVPTAIPDGFSLSNITLNQTPLRNTYTAIYTNGEKNLKITVRDHLKQGPSYMEQSSGAAEEYQAQGITYYLFANLEGNRAAWLYESYECDISGDVTIEELKQMIDSIQKG